MSVRQYIGARYVTKIYSNSQDPSSTEWESNVNYEPLTMVTYNYGSYLSKKDVPANVGNPAANPAYWAQTGFYNGQIAQINNEIAEINANDIIFIGDSYGVDTAVGGSAWASLLSSEYSDSTFLVQGGTGFASDLYISSNWLSMLTAHVATLTTAQKNSVKQIIVVGGANDSNLLFDGTATENDIKNRIAAFCSYINANLPNAVVKCAFVGWYRNNNRHTAYLKVRDIYASYYADNYAYFANGENIMKANDMIRTDDLIHPNTESSKYLTSFINSLATNGDFKMSRSLEVTPTSIADNPCTVDYMNKIFAEYDGDNCTLTFYGAYTNNFFRMTFAAGTTIQGNDAFYVCDLTGSPIGADGHSPLAIIECPIYDDNGTSLGKKTLGFTIQNNKLVCKVLETSSIQWRTALVPYFTLSINLRNS